KEYAVPSAGITMGRDASAGVVVAQNDVSRKHAEVIPAANGAGYEVRDHSANGVFVNGERIDKTQVLSRADVIRIGTEEFRFYADAAAAAPKPAVPAVPASPAVTAPPVVPATPVVAAVPVAPVPQIDPRPV